MRQPVVITTSEDLDSPALVWAGLVGDQIVCVMPPRVSDSPLYRRAVMDAVALVIKGTDIEPEWPWGSDPVAEG